MSSVSPAVEVSGLRLSFDRWGHQVRALDEVSLSISAGDWLTIVGPNGSGKSSLLRCIAGWQQPDHGTIRLFGQDIASMSRRQLAEQVFYVHQDPLKGTAPTLSVHENLAVADIGPVVPESRAARSARYETLLEPLGLAGRARQLCETLSGGQRQLLTLAIAGLRQVRVLLLDEAMSALDPAKRELCMNQIRLMQAQGTTVVQVSHHAEATGLLGRGARSGLLRITEGRALPVQPGNDRLDMDGGISGVQALSGAPMPERHHCSPDTSAADHDGKRAP